MGPGRQDRAGGRAASMPAAVLAPRAWPGWPGSSRAAGLAWVLLTVPGLAGLAAGLGSPPPGCAGLAWLGWPGSSWPLRRRCAPGSSSLCAAGPCMPLGISQDHQDGL
jgi:hypothetical protein